MIAPELKAVHRRRDDSLIELKTKLYNPIAAEAVRRLGETAVQFDSEAFIEFITDNPAFRYSHLFADDDE